MTILTRLVVGPHLAPDQMIDIAESSADAAVRLQRHLDRCAACSEQVDRLRATLHESSLEEMLAEDSEDAERLDGLVDWNRFQASVREEMLARSVRRGSFLRRWTGVRVAPGPVTAWAVGVLLALSFAAVGGFWHLAVDHAAPEATRDESGGRDPGGSESWVVIDEPESLEVEAIAWSESDFFSELDGLEPSEEEVLRALILEAGGLGAMK